MGKTDTPSPIGCDGVANEASCRATLVRIRDKIEKCVPDTKSKSATVDAVELLMLLALVSAWADKALSAPARNCDRFATGDVAKDADDAMRAMLDEMRGDGNFGFRGIASFLLSPMCAEGQSGGLTKPKELLLEIYDLLCRDEPLNVPRLRDRITEVLFDGKGDPGAPSPKAEAGPTQEEKTKTTLESVKKERDSMLDAIVRINNWCAQDLAENAYVGDASGNYEKTLHGLCDICRPFVASAALLKKYGGTK